MIALFRLLFMATLVLTVVYLSLSVYSRAVRRGKLRDEWEVMAAEGRAPDRESFIAEGMAEYEGGLRRKLLWLVYIVPLTLFVFVIVMTNYA